MSSCSITIIGLSGQPRLSNLGISGNIKSVDTCKSSLHD